MRHRQAISGRGQRDAANAVSHPDRDEVIDAQTLEGLGDLRMPSGALVGLVRDVRMIEPPSKWMREVR